jgi:hypothetical protein
MFARGEIGVRAAGKIINQELKRYKYTSDEKAEFYRAMQQGAYKELADYMLNKLNVALDNIKQGKLIKRRPLTPDEKQAGLGKLGPKGKTRRSANIIPLKTVRMVDKQGNVVKYRCRPDTRFPKPKKTTVRPRKLTEVIVEEPEFMPGARLASPPIFTRVMQ